MNQIKQMASRKGESGQAIVLIALFMIVMLAMVGVAIDGGGLFWLWRNAQNAADTASLQAAYDKCTGGDNWVQTGLDAAASNGFDLVNPGYENMVVQVGEVPVNGTKYVRVRIQATKPKYFIQLVYRGPLEVIAESLVYCSAAVDFSDLPGIVALGDCTCGNNQPRVSSTGSQVNIEGGIHSNCDVSLSANNSGNGGTVTGGVSTPTGDPDIDTNHVPITGGENVREAVTNVSEISINLYFPTGEIYEEIKSTYPTMVHHVTGDKNFSSADNPLEGLWAVEGNVSFPPNGITFGPRGLTVVAHGTIDYQNTDRGSLTNNWHYYGSAYQSPTAAAPYNDPGVMVEYSRGTGSGILAFTDWAPSGQHAESCGSGNNVSGFKWQGNGDGSDEDGWDIDLWGIILVPKSTIAWSGSKTTIRGSVIGMTVDLSGARSRLIPDPNLLQPMAPVMNNAG